MSTVRHKCWHIVNPKSNAHLVEVSRTLPNGMVEIQYLNGIYRVPECSLFEYDCSKGRVISKLKYLNKYEICDCIARCLSRQQTIVRFDRRVVIDLSRMQEFDGQGDSPSAKYIRQLLHRLLICDTVKQFLCVHNNSSYDRYQNNYLIQLLCEIGRVAGLWPYRLSMRSVIVIFATFFTDFPLAASIGIRSDVVFKITMCLPRITTKNLLQGFEKQMLGQGRIFQMLCECSIQMKMFYKIPVGSQRIPKNNPNMAQLIDSLLSLGLPVTQVNNYFFIFSLIMNLALLPFMQTTRVSLEGAQSKYYAIKDKNQYHENVRYILGPEMLTALEQEVNMVNHDGNEGDYTRLNLQALMRVLWEEIVGKIVSDLNRLLCSQESKLDGDKQFVFCSAPVSREESIENQMRSRLNDDVLSLAFCKAIGSNPKTVSWQCLFAHSKEEYGNDINRELFAREQLQQRLYIAMRSSAFVRTLLELKLKCSLSDLQKDTQEYINILATVQQNQCSSNNFADFVIKTDIGKENSIAVPLIEEMIERIKRSTNDHAEKQVEYEIVDVPLGTFCRRYLYTSLILSIRRQYPVCCQDIVSAVEKAVRMYIKEHPKDELFVVAAGGKQYVRVTIEQFSRLEDQVERQIIAANKIKRQLRTRVFRRVIIQHMPMFFRKVSACKLLLRAFSFSKKLAMKAIKQRPGLLALLRVLDRAAWRRVKEDFNILKAREAVCLIIGLLRMFKTAEWLKSKCFDLLVKRYRLSIVAAKCGLVGSASKQLAFGSIYGYSSMLKREANNHSEVTMIPSIIGTEPEQVILEPPIIHGSSPEKLFLPKLLSVESSLNVSTIAVPSVPVPSELVSTFPLHPAPISQEQSPPSISNASPGEIPSDFISENRLYANQVEQKHIPLPLQIHETRQQQEPPQTYIQAANQALEESHSIDKSQLIRSLVREQFLSLQDTTNFSFQSWEKESVGFQVSEPQRKQVLQELFEKYDGNNSAAVEPEEEQLNIDLLIKQRVLMNPFFTYLVGHGRNCSEQLIDKTMAHQSKLIKEPLLAAFPSNKHQTAINSFNILLKLSGDKNSTKSKVQLLNSLVQPIITSYQTSQQQVSTVFDSEPAVISDYSWEHNAVKDEIFLQMVKQLTYNEDEDSLQQVAKVLEIFTRHYYPSPQLIYSFLHFLKSVQSSSSESLALAFLNALKFAQAMEGFKGVAVSVLENELRLKEKECSLQLEPRETMFSETELHDQLKIEVRLLNNRRYRFKVCNDIISTYKRRLLHILKLLDLQEHFLLYLQERQGQQCLQVDENCKAIDFLVRYPQMGHRNILYLRLKNYFPFRIKMFNVTRLVYLNSVSEERLLPWFKDDYGEIVAQGMLFGEFEEDRLHNYLDMQGYKTGDNVDLSLIKAKYAEMTRQKVQRVCELEYFKYVKECGFLLAKAYRFRADHLEQTLKLITRIITKPMEICFYEGSKRVASIDIRRVIRIYFENNQLQLQLLAGTDYHDVSRCDTNNIRLLTIRNAERIHELHGDILAYTSLYMQKNFQQQRWS